MYIISVIGILYKLYKYIYIYFNILNSTKIPNTQNLAQVRMSRNKQIHNIKMYN